MTYTQGGLIQASDYNNFINFSNQVNQLYADTNAGTTIEGVADWGYGKTTILPVTVGSLVTAAQWSSLFGAIHECGIHQGTTVAPIPASVSSGDLVVAFNDISTQTLSQVIATLGSNRLNVGPGQLSSVVLGPPPAAPTPVTSSNTGLQYACQLDFGSWNAARHFFNLGSQITFAGSITSGTSTPSDVIWNSLFAQISTVKFQYSSVYSGSPSVITSNIGFYDLTTTFQTVLQITHAPTGDYMLLQARFADTIGTNGKIDFVFSMVNVAPGIVDGIVTIGTGVNKSNNITGGIAYTGTVGYTPGIPVSLSNPAVPVWSLNFVPPGPPVGLPLTVSVSPLSTTSSIVGPGLNTSSPIIATPHDGLAPYSYAWTNSSSTASVVSVNVTNGGSGYTVAPGVVFSSGAATAVASIGPGSGGASVASLTLNNAGSGYLSPPSISFTGGGGGAGVAATANMVQTGSTGSDTWGISSGTIVDLAAGYTGNPTLVTYSGSNIVVTPTATFTQHPTYTITGLTLAGITSATLNDGTFPLVFGSVLVGRFYDTPTGNVTVAGGVVTNITLSTGGVLNYILGESPDFLQIYADTGGPGVRIVDCDASVAILSTLSVDMTWSTPDRGVMNTSAPPTVNWSGGGGSSGSSVVPTTQTSSVTPTYSISSFTITNNGAGYTIPPGVVISGSGGASATAVLAPVANVVTSIAVTFGGSGYLVAPGVSFTGGGGGVGAAATSVISAVPGTVTFNLQSGTIVPPGSVDESTTFSATLTNGQTTSGSAIVTITDSSSPTPQVVSKNVPWSMVSVASSASFTSAAFSPLSIGTGSSSTLTLSFSGLTPSSTNIPVGNITLTPSSGLSGTSGTASYIVPTSNPSGVGSITLNYTGIAPGSESVAATHFSGSHTGNVTVNPVFVSAAFSNPSPVIGSSVNLALAFSGLTPSTTTPLSLTITPSSGLSGPSGTAAYSVVSDGSGNGTITIPYTTTATGAQSANAQYLTTSHIATTNVQYNPVMISAVFSPPSAGTGSTVVLVVSYTGADPISSPGPVLSLGALVGLSGFTSGAVQFGTPQWNSSSGVYTLNTIPYTVVAGPTHSLTVVSTGVTITPTF